MASSNGNRTTAQIRSDLEAEREQLAGAVEQLREELGEATDVTGKLKAKLPVVAGGGAAAAVAPRGGARRRRRPSACGRRLGRRGPTPPAGDAKGTRRFVLVAGRFPTAIDHGD